MFLSVLNTSFKYAVQVETSNQINKKLTEVKSWQTWRPVNETKLSELLYCDLWKH